MAVGSRVTNIIFTIELRFSTGGTRTTRDTARIKQGNIFSFPFLSVLRFESKYFYVRIYEQGVLSGNILLFNELTLL